MKTIDFTTLRPQPNEIAAFLAAVMNRTERGKEWPYVAIDNMLYQPDHPQDFQILISKTEKGNVCFAGQVPAKDDYGRETTEYVTDYCPVHDKLYETYLPETATFEAAMQAMGDLCFFG